MGLTCISSEPETRGSGSMLPCLANVSTDTPGLKPPGGGLSLGSDDRAEFHGGMLSRDLERSHHVTKTYNSTLLITNRIPNKRDMKRT